MAIKQRNPYWDTLKAMLIVLVVLGHTGTAMGNKWLSVIYAFHMPLFIFISGYFSKKQPLSLLGGGNKRLILLFLIFNTAYLVLEIAFGGGISLHRLLSPAFALWYILSLIYWRVILQLLPQRLLDNRILVLIFSFMVSLGAGFVPIGSELSFQRAFTFFPFFMMGYYARQDGWVERLRTLNRIPFVIILFGLLAICYYSLPVFYSNIPYESLADLGMRAMQLIIALILCIALLNVMPAKLGRFTDIGRYTLLIYLLHPPIIKIMKVFCQYVGIEQNPLVGIAMASIALIVIYSSRNMKIFKYLV